MRDSDRFFLVLFSLLDGGWCGKMLGSAFAQTYSENDWYELIAHMCLHKLNYRKMEAALWNSHSYCSYLLHA